MLELVIGNKNYSSWSMRPWVLMQHFGMPFRETTLRFDFTPGSEFYRRIGTYSPAHRVPVLVDETGFAVWDTFAIVETLAERFPEHAVWPRDPRQRARARSLCAEMHAGFGALRSHCPMNIESTFPEIGERVLHEQEAVRSDLARIVQMWSEQLGASGGPFLFGGFSAADAYFAPVCVRIRNFALPVPALLEAYVERVFATPGVAAWVADALAEQDFIVEDEPYRKSR